VLGFGFQAVRLNVEHGEFIRKQPWAVLRWKRVPYAREAINYVREGNLVTLVIEPHTAPGETKAWNESVC